MDFNIYDLIGNPPKGNMMLDIKKINSCRHLLPSPGPEVVKELLEEIEKFREALTWCSGSNDFGRGGKARDGWLRICEPLLK